MENFIFLQWRLLHDRQKTILDTIDLRFSQNSDKIELSEIGPILNDYKAISTNINKYFADINVDTVIL